jgi:hypothetical protein
MQKKLKKIKMKKSNSLNATGPARFGSLAIGGAARQARNRHIRCQIGNAPSPGRDFQGRSSMSGCPCPALAKTMVSFICGFFLKQNRKNADWDDMSFLILYN